MLSNLEEFQHPQIKLHLTGSNEGVPAKTERTRRQRKCAAAVSIEASQRIDWPAAPNNQDRSDFNVAVMRKPFRVPLSRISPATNPPASSSNSRMIASATVVFP